MKTQDVVMAFAHGRVAHSGNMLTNGKEVYSYQLKIAQWTDDGVEVLDKKLSPSMTTSKHISQVLKLYPNARRVLGFPKDGT